MRPYSGTESENDGERTVVLRAVTAPSRHPERDSSDCRCSDDENQEPHDEHASPKGATEGCRRDVAGLSGGTFGGTRPNLAARGKEGSGKQIRGYQKVSDRQEGKSGEAHSGRDYRGPSIGSARHARGDSSIGKEGHRRKRGCPRRDLRPRLPTRRSSHPREPGRVATRVRSEQGFRAYRRVRGRGLGEDSGTAGFSELMAEAAKSRSRPFDLVVFSSLSRMTRGGIQAALETLRVLQGQKVSWHRVDHPTLNFDSGTLDLARNVILAVLAAVDEDYRRNVSQKTRAAAARKRALAAANDTDYEGGRPKKRVPPPMPSIGEAVRIRAIPGKGRPRDLSASWDPTLLGQVCWERNGPRRLQPQRPPRSLRECQSEHLLHRSRGGILESLRTRVLVRGREAR